MPHTLVQGSAPGAWGATSNGSTPTNGVTVAWGASRGVGNLLVLCVNTDGSFASPPTGWTLDQTQANISVGYIYFRVADNTATDAPTLNNAARTAIAWAEYSGNTASPSDVSTSNGTNTSAVTAWSTGTTAATAQADELAVAMWGSSVSGAAFRTFSAQTNSFVEVAEVGTTNGAGINVGLTVATKALAATGTQESTATPSAACNRIGLIATYKAAAATKAPPPLLRRRTRFFRGR